MGFRFRKRLRIGNRLCISLGKTGGSLSIDGRGLTTDVGRKGVQETFGFPHTGLSYQTKRIPYRGSAHVGIVLLILATIILVLAHAITAAGATLEPIAPPHDATLLGVGRSRAAFCMETRPSQSG